MVRLLIVEDHPELASLMVAAAESRGHEATAVHTGEAALALLRPGAFQAAVVDLLLPDMRGSTVLVALRDQGIPAVAVSGVFKGDRFAREATEVHGARAFFEKPFELEHLLAFVEQLCGVSGLAPSADDESDEVLVFENPALMDLEDEPGFVPQEEDEPLFGLTADAAPPVVQGLTLVEEAGDPLGDEPLAIQLPPEPAPEPEPAVADEPAPVEPAPAVAGEPLWDEPPPAEEAVARPKTPPTLRTVDVEGIVPLAELNPEAAATAPEPVPEPVPEPEPTSVPVETAPEPAPEPVPEPTSVPVETVPEPAPESHPMAMMVSDEELSALEALGPAAPPPAPAPEPAPTEALPAAEAAPLAEPLPVAEVAAPVPAEPEPGIALPFGDREKVWTQTGGGDERRRAPPAWSLSGDLRDTSVPRLLSAYYEARHSGELKLRQGTLQKVVYFEAGRPVYAASNLAQERFLRFCLRRGVVTEPKAQEAARLAREQNLRSSEALERLGFVDARRRQGLIVEQVKEVLWSTFGWNQGQYGFSPLRPPSAGRVKVSLFPGDLVLEGVLRSEPLVTLRQSMPRSRRLFPTAAPPFGLHELTLKGQQALVLAYTDGTKTVEDLLTLTDLPEREVLATLRGLELIGVLEERRDEPGNSRRISFGL